MLFQFFEFTYLGPFLAHLWTILDHFWTIFWTIFGPFLDPFWTIFGTILDHFWTLLNHFLAIFGPFHLFFTLSCATIDEFASFTAQDKCEK